MQARIAHLHQKQAPDQFGATAPGDDSAREPADGEHVMDHILHLVIQQAIKEVVHEITQRQRHALQVRRRVRSAYVLQQRPPRRQASRAHVNGHDGVNEAHSAIGKVGCASAQDAEAQEDVE